MIFTKKETLKPEEEQIAAGIILQHFYPEKIPEGNERMDAVRTLLVEKINYLLDHDFEKLLWILYRIDVSEEKAKSALAEKSDHAPAEVLSDLIIERQIETAKTRIEYRDKKREE